MSRWRNVNAARIFKLYLLFLAVSLLTRAYMAPVDVIDIDESAHITGSRVLMDGGLLYTDFIDNKPPLLYVYYAIAQWLLGHGLAQVRLFTILLTVPLTALACAAFYEYRSQGVVAALLFLVFSAAFLAHDMHAANAELLMILPGAWALVLVRGPDRALRPLPSLLAGVFLGVGFLLKYQILTWLPAVLAAGLYESIRSKQPARWALAAAAVLAGAALPFLLTYAWFARHHGDVAFIYWNFINNFAYAGNPIAFREATGRFASYFLPFLVITLPLWWFTFRTPRASESEYSRSLISALIVVSTLTCFIGFRFFPHYFIQLYVPLCLGAAPHITSLLVPISGNGRRFIVYGVTVWILFTLANLYLYYGNSGMYRETDPVFKRVAQRLRQDSCYAGGSLFVWGYTPLYYHAQLKPASRFAVLSQGGLTGYISGNLERVQSKKPVEQSPQGDNWDILMSDLEKNQATYIVDTSPAGIYRWDRYPIRDFPRLQQYLEDHYDAFDNIEGVVLYRRRNCGEEAR